MLISFAMVILSALFGACIVPFAKIASGVVPPISIVFWRVFLASIIFVPIATRSKTKISIKQIKTLAPISLILSVNFTAAIVSVRFIPTSLTPIIYAMTPFVTYFLVQIKNKKIDLQKRYLLGLIVGFSGLLIATYQSIKVSSDWHSILIGVSIVLVGVFCFAWYGIRSKDFQKDMSPIQISWINVIVASIALLPFALYEVITTSYLAKFDAKTSATLFGIALFGSVLAYLTYQYAIKRTSASVASLMTYIQPIFGVFLSLVLVGENITPTFLLGAIMAIAGAYIASK